MLHNSALIKISFCQWDVDFHELGITITQFIIFKNNCHFDIEIHVKSSKTHLVCPTSNLMSKKKYTRDNDLRLQSADNRKACNSLMTI